MPKKQTQYQKDLNGIYEHRKRWVGKAIQDKRYIRGKINKIIKDAIFPRNRGDVTTDPFVRAAVLHKTGGRCYLCWREYITDEALARAVPRLYFFQLQIDHIVPLSKGGPNAISNYMPACSRCNNLKSNLSMDEAQARIARDMKRKGY